MSVWDIWNKGYILSLDKIYANYIPGSGYTEQIKWTDYDFDKRKLGPDYYELQVFNPDKACGWTTIGKIDVKNKIDISAYEDSVKIKLVKASQNSAMIPEFFDCPKFWSSRTGTLKAGPPSFSEIL